MSLKSVISLIATGAAVWFYKQSLEAEYKEKEAQLQKDREYFLDELAEANEKLNPNGNKTSAPLAITGSVRFGGLTLNQLEVWLNIRNYSERDVEIGDIRSRLWVGWIRSERVIPSNSGIFKIPAGKALRLRLYARGDVAYPNDYKEVKQNLCALAGISKIKDNTVIPVQDLPAELDLQYLWYWSGGFEECVVFDVPCDFEYRFAGWTVGAYSGYNAGREKQQEANSSYWQKYDSQPIDE